MPFVRSRTQGAKHPKGVRVFYVSIPLWGEQFRFLDRAADLTGDLLGDVIKAAGLAYIAQNATSEEAKERLALAVDTYCVNGCTPELELGVSGPTCRRVGRRRLRPNLTARACFVTKQHRAAEVVLPADVTATPLHPAAPLSLIGAEGETAAKIRDAVAYAWDQLPQNVQGLLVDYWKSPPERVAKALPCAPVVAVLDSWPDFDRELVRCGAEGFQFSFVRLLVDTVGVYMIGAVLGHAFAHVYQAARGVAFEHQEEGVTAELAKSWRFETDSLRYWILAHRWCGAAKQLRKRIRSAYRSRPDHPVVSPEEVNRRSGLFEPPPSA